jgi:hypothetical protein
MAPAHMLTYLLFYLCALERQLQCTGRHGLMVCLLFCCFPASSTVPAPCWLLSKNVLNK